jgi:hypothetical protein
MRMLPGSTVGDGRIENVRVSEMSWTACLLHNGSFGPINFNLNCLPEVEALRLTPVSGGRAKNRTDLNDYKELLCETHYDGRKVICPFSYAELT